MYKIKNTLVILLLSTNIFASEMHTKFNYFGNVMLSSLDKDGFILNDYLHHDTKKDLSLSPFSKLGGQLTMYNDKYTFTAQLIGTHNNDGYQVDVPWLNVKYNITENLAIRAGRMQTTLLINSDSINIDYIHPMAHASYEVYRVMAVPSYNGIEFIYSGDFNDDYGYSITFSPLVRAKNDVNNGVGFQTELELKKAIGLRLSLTDYEGFEFVISYTKLNLFMQDSDSLKRSVAALASVGNDMSEYSYENKDSEVITLGINYEYENYQLNSEIVQHRTQSMRPEKLAYFMMLAYKQNKFTPFIAYSRSSNDANRYDTSHINTFGSEQLSQAKRGLDDNLYFTNSNQITQSLGLRYDIQPGLALKAQVDRITTSNYGSLSQATVQNFGYERAGILARKKGTSDQAVHVFSFGLNFAF